MYPPRKSRNEWDANSNNGKKKKGKITSHMPLRLRQEYRNLTFVFLHLMFQTICTKRLYRLRYHSFILRTYYQPESKQPNVLYGINRSWNILDACTGTLHLMIPYMFLVLLAFRKEGLKSAKSAKLKISNVT